MSGSLLSSQKGNSVHSMPQRSRSASPARNLHRSCHSSLAPLGVYEKDLLLPQQPYQSSNIVTFSRCTQSLSGWLHLFPLLLMDLLTGFTGFSFEHPSLFGVRSCFDCVFRFPNASTGHPSVKCPSVRIFRSRVKRPGPQLTLQVVQCCHSLKVQG